MSKEKEYKKEYSKEYKKRGKKFLEVTEEEIAKDEFELQEQIAHLETVISGLIEDKETNLAHLEAEFDKVIADESEKLDALQALL